MKRRLLTGPRLIGGLLVAALAVALFFALRDPAIRVETEVVSRGPLTVTVEDEGETRVTDLYVVSAPVTGQLLRVPLKPGDTVVARSTLVGRIQPLEPAPLDPRSAAQAEAQVRALQADLAANRSTVAEARAELLLAEREHDRLAALAGRGFVSQANLDRARTARDRARSVVAQSAQSAAATEQRLVAARAALITSGTSRPGRGAVAVTSPVSGFVLRVPQESERVVVAGTPLVEVGDPERLEIVTDLLSADAVRVRPGAPVEIDAWGGDRLLHGRVRLVEPFGFTKVSALGVEEQRVNVAIDFTDPREAWRRLGHGYRAVVRIGVWHAPDVVRVPISALFRSGSGWAVFKVGERDRARLTAVEIGPMTDEAAMVRGGLGPGDRVILHPGDRVEDGIRVTLRNEA
jgi:HlyD family secretion protein